jgi:M6 family metalloprotease-like protein
MRLTIAATAIVVAACALMAGAPRADALERGTFGWRTAEVFGKRPLLAIWVREPDETPRADLDKYVHYFSDTIFGTNPGPGIRPRETPNVVAYFREVSGGKFEWTRTRLIGPLRLSIKGKKPDEVARLALQAAAAEGRFDFKALDANHDGRIDANELGVLVMANTDGEPRWQDFSASGRDIAIEGQGVTFAGRIAMRRENDDLAVINRELFHILVPQATDLDGVPGQCFALNRNVTLMAAANAGKPSQTVYLDPFHKMMAGWNEPRLYAVGAPGRTRLSALHVPATPGEDLRRPLLIYDGTRGSSEFFLMEYRTPSALGYDIDASTSGLVIWHVMLDANGRLYRAPADRANCKGKTFPVPTLFTRAGPDWKLGGGRGYWGGDGPFRPKWMDGTEVGIEISVAKHEQVDWAIEVSWTARREAAVAQQAGGGRP